MTALHTFGVYAAEVQRAIEAGELTDDTAPIEEIDVRADTPAEARQLAQAEADDLYGPGSVIFPMRPGGTGGLVSFYGIGGTP